MTKKRIGIVFSAVIFLMIGLSLFSAFRGRKLIVASDTTYLTAPLADDGLPDYNTWLIEQLMDGVTAENNAAVPLWKAMGSGGVMAEQRTVLFAMLQMPVPPDRQGDFEATSLPLANAVRKELIESQVEDTAKTPSEDVDGHDPSAETMMEMGMMLGEDTVGGPIVDDVIHDAMAQPWGRDEAPAIARWIDAHAREFDLLHEAAERPKFASPSPTLLAGPNQSLVYCVMPHHQVLRSAVHNLSLRAMLRIGESEFDKAWEDCQAMFRIANHVPADSLIGALVQIACRQVAQKATLRLLDQPLDRELLKTMEATLAQMPPVPPLAQALNKYERLFFITACIRLAGHRGVGENQQDMPGFLQSSLAVDWNEVLRRGNRTYDELVSGLSQPDWKKRREAIVAYADGPVFGDRPRLRQLLTRSGRTDLAGTVTMSMILPVIAPIVTAFDRDNANLDLLRIAAALARHRLENGAYPKSLDELSLPSELQTDFRHAQPYVYQKLDEGYLLHSTGANGEDDNGSHEQLRVFRGLSADHLHALPESEAPPEAAGKPNWHLDWSTDGIRGADDESIRVPVPTRETLGKR